MSGNEFSIHKNLQSSYNSFYDSNTKLWRELGARQKFENIVCLSKHMNFNRVLEVGAGEGSILQLLNDSDFCNELYALEISDSGIEQIKKRKLSKLKQAAKFDGYNLPFKDQYFDLVILSHVLEHVEFPRALLREILRVSHYQIIEIPRDYKYNVDKRINTFLAYGHISVFTPTLLRYLLKSEQFEIIKDKQAFTSKDLLMYNIRYKQFKTNSFAVIKLNIWILIRNFAYLIAPQWRRETMINSYTVLTKQAGKPKSKHNKIIFTE